MADKITLGNLKSAKGSNVDLLHVLRRWLLTDRGRVA